LLGDQMEIEIFKISQYTILDNSTFSSKNGNKIKIFRRIEFNSEAQCMSVIIQGNSLNPKNRKEIYTKGASESIVNKCRIESVPKNLSIIINEYSKSGYRILALAYKEFGN
jgi:magnesium-transporting ATPase (P-type)